ncbi:MAG: MgtC/SapB family protein [Oscillospiraceae bacterium]|nr:MgtC/SapB family protein [Oscillospiraceae bacterium]
MSGFFSYLQNMEPSIGSIFLRLLLATALSGLIGWERGVKKRPAGLRTFVLVCIGSCLAMMTNEYICVIYNTGDTARMAAQVISGVGFLGAGTIIVTHRNQVKGLTTAAGLWACASMGIAIGAGFYAGAILGFLFIFFGIILLHKIDSYFNSKSRIINLYIEIENFQVLHDVVDYAREQGYSISSFEVNKGDAISDTGTTILLEINLGRQMKHYEVISEISMVPGIRYVEEIS